ncbi:MAG: hypothetical protein KDA96_22125, partial [Planctomycetaceae bacterium]|nr:hypothetical protein [Planctomycetaceae bacterium]
GGEVPPLTQFQQGRRGEQMRPGQTPAGRPDTEQDPMLRPLLSRLINKTNTDEEVVAAAKAIEDYAAKNPLARKQIAEIANRIIDADVLSRYGTPRAQEFLRLWAVEFRKPVDPSPEPAAENDR